MSDERSRDIWDQGYQAALRDVATPFEKGVVRKVRSSQTGTDVLIIDLVRRGGPGWLWSIDMRQLDAGDVPLPIQDD